MSQNLSAIPAIPKSEFSRYSGHCLENTSYLYALQALRTGFLQANYKGQEQRDHHWRYQDDISRLAYLF